MPRLASQTQLFPKFWALREQSNDVFGQISGHRSYVQSRAANFDRSDNQTLKLKLRLSLQPPERFGLNVAV